MPSSSSSQSRRVSWQPSHEANLNTPSLRREASGRAAEVVEAVISQLPYGEQRFGSVIEDDGTVTAQQQRAELAVSAVAGGTAHVPLKGDLDTVRGYAPVDQLAGGGAHHDLRTADERCGD